MRSLTITRRKTFVGSLATMKVYVEDPMSGELTISGTPCRKLGTLKNGQTQTFSVGDHTMKLFVIADTLSKDACNEVYTIPAGTESITLSGQNCFSLMAGNPFRFDNVTAEDTLQNRKSGTKKFKGILIYAIIVGVFLGVSCVLTNLDDNEPKTFTDDGIQITLTKAFEEVDMEYYAVCYGSKEVAVYVVKESYADYPILIDCSLNEYAQMVVGNNDFDITKQVQTVDGLTFFQYKGRNTQSQREYQFLVSVYKSDTAMWMVQFAAETDDWDACYDDILQWAKSVKFVD